MRTVRMSRLAVLVAVSLSVLTLIACVALKAVTDIMMNRAQQLAIAAMNRNDARQLMQLNKEVTSWSLVGDYLGWVLAAIVVVGGVLATVGFYRYHFQPLAALASAMKRFSEGLREVRAETGHGTELATVASAFNEMADAVTGQHQRMLKFLGGTTHELKEPVHAMRALLQEFAPDKRFPDEALGRKRLAAVSNELDRLERMVDNYLDASRVEWRRLDLQQGRYEFRTLVQDVSQLYETFSRKHRLALSFPERPIWVFADPERLSQVIHTLLTNAIAFSPRGGVVEVCVDCEGVETTLRITDHGIGISEEDLAKTFEPFQKVSSALLNSPGAAVALSVARRIVQAHLGRIEVSSKVGEGSTFRVHLPLAAPIAAEEAACGRAAAHNDPAAEQHCRPVARDGRTPKSPEASARG